MALGERGDLSCDLVIVDEDVEFDVFLSDILEETTHRVVAVDVGSDAEDSAFGIFRMDAGFGVVEIFEFEHSVGENDVAGSRLGKVHCNALALVGFGCLPPRWKNLPFPCQNKLP